MGRSRHGIIGPDDPSISYRDNLFAYVGRAISEYLDSFEPWKRANRYAYVCNNPINYIDPLGLDISVDGEKEVGVEKMMNQSGLPLVITEENKVEVAEGPRNANGTSETLANNIRHAINDPYADVQLNFGNNLEALFGGYNEETGKHDIDLYDLNKYEEFNEERGKAAFTHEIAEAYGEARFPDFRENRWIHKYYAIPEQNSSLHDYGVDDSRMSTEAELQETVTSKNVGEVKYIIEWKNSSTELTADYDFNEKNPRIDLKKVIINQKQ